MIHTQNGCISLRDFPFFLVRAEYKLRSTSRVVKHASWWPSYAGMETQEDCHTAEKSW